ncbi:MAG: Gfo/Idh/MocA family oxidoreductase [Magnetococcales bacterium]|nr:Gfo/Idh/MocA family oxidoreductase [Magnetococcales bacterium]MBF0156078.1 Gfo/Idh/MocA family oxidoreductase [Magnetococcales bacterium]
MIRVGLIGFGYWGPNLARNFATQDQTRVVAISDLRESQLQRAAKLVPGVRVTTDYRELIQDPSIEVITIATPVSTHFDLAMAALEGGKHVWIEKPMCATAEQARRLIDLARRRNLVLHVDHTFVYTGAVRKLRELVASGALGNIQYFDSTRINLGLFQHDVDVIWDLAVHDFSILDSILDKQPVAISAHGASFLPGSPVNLAYVTLFYDSGMIAHVHVSWLAPVKIRTILLGGDKKMIVFDDLVPMEKIKIYDKGIQVFDDPHEIHRMRVGYRIGDMCSPNLDTTEALQTETGHFLACVRDGRPSLTGGEAGLRVVNWLEKATLSLNQQGRLVSLTEP